MIFLHEKRLPRSSSAVEQLIFGMPVERYKIGMRGTGLWDVGVSSLNVCTLVQCIPITVPGIFPSLLFL